MEKSCCFCDKFAFGQAATNAWDTILYESSNFVVVPTRGSIVKGWLLVIPKQHFPCIGALDLARRNELDHVRSVVSSIVKDVYGSVLQFEHGPVDIGQPVGCGVDHAHLHIVGIDMNLIAKSSKAPEFKGHWEKVNSLNRTVEAFGEKMPYLYVEDTQGVQWMLKHPEIGSQVLRKAIATQYNLADCYDWKRYSFHENVEQTIHDLAPSLQIAGAFNLRSLAV